MSKLAKIGLVLGGYVMSCFLAIAVVYINGLFIPNVVAQASSGMAAFGDFIFLLVLFGFLALFPTGLAIYFLLNKFLKRKE